MFWWGHIQRRTYCKEGNIVLSALGRGFIPEVEFLGLHENRLTGRRPKCCQRTPDLTWRGEVSFKTSFTSCEKQSCWICFPLEDSSLIFPNLKPTQELCFFSSWKQKSLETREEITCTLPPISPLTQVSYFPLSSQGWILGWGEEENYFCPRAHPAPFAYSSSAPLSATEWPCVLNKWIILTFWLSEHRLKGTWNLILRGT